MSFIAQAYSTHAIKLSDAPLAFMNADGESLSFILANLGSQYQAYLLVSYLK